MCSDRVTYWAHNSDVIATLNQRRMQQRRVNQWEAISRANYIFVWHDVKPDISDCANVV